MIRRSPRTTRSSGFTLIEVLVAFAVLGLVLAALLQVFSAELKQYRVASAYATATGLAESKLSQFGISDPMAVGESRGRFNGEFRWQMRVEPYSGSDEAGNDEVSVRLYHVFLKVAWGAADNERSVALETLRLGQVE